MVSRDRLDLPQEQRDQRRQTRRNSLAANLGFSSVTRGTTRFLGESSVEVGEEGSTNGSQTVYGTLRIVGVLNGDGSISWAGSATFEGPWTMVGEGTIEGNTHLAGDLTVDESGRVVIGDVILAGERVTVADMFIGMLTSGRPGLHYPGGELSSDGDQIALTSGAGVVGVGNGFAALVQGSRAVRVTAAGHFLDNLPTTTQPPNLYVNPSTNQVFRSTATGTTNA